MLVNIRNEGDTVSQNNKKCKSVKFDFLSIIHVHYKVPGYHTSYIIPDTCIHPVPVLFDVLRVSLRVVEEGSLLETPLFYSVSVTTCCA